MKSNKLKIGGMARPDGIMFKSSNHMVIVRKEDDNVSIIKRNVYSLLNLKIFQKPFLRGLIGILELPYQIIMNIFWVKKKVKRSFKESIQFPLKLFIFICFWVGFGIIQKPIYDVFSPFIPIPILAKLSMFFLLIVYAVALYDILFGSQLLQYHGAEHKIIYTYTHNEALTVANVKKSPKENVRCGSSFIAILFMLLFLPFETNWWLVLIYISIAYELMTFASKNEKSILSKIIFAPGFFIQLFITREPTSSQIRTGIIGFNSLLDCGTASSIKRSLPLFSYERA